MNYPLTVGATCDPCEIRRAGLCPSGMEYLALGFVGHCIELLRSGANRETLLLSGPTPESNAAIWNCAGMILNETCKTVPGV